MKDDYSVALWIMFGITLVAAGVFAAWRYSEYREEWEKSNKAWAEYNAREAANDPTPPPAPQSVQPVRAPVVYGSTSNRPPVRSTMVTQGQYRRIFSGMPYSEVVSILGRQGNQTSSMSTGFGTYESYEWSNEEGGTMSVTFDNGVVSSKFQFNLPQ
jgi:hypothetical protein